MAADTTLTGPALNDAASPDGDPSPTATAPAPATTPAPAIGRVLVQVRGLTMKHGETLIQRGIDFDIHAGEVLAIVGGSGSGKSTLLRHLIGLQKPAEGQVLLEGQDVYGDDVDEVRALRQRFGVMFQSGALWSSMTVAENLMLPLELSTDLTPEERLARARAQLAAVDLAGSENLAPSDLSGGMRKRVALARALMLQPPLLYLDEPAAGLDPVNTDRLNALILSLSDDRGVAVVMVTHDIPSVFAVADRMLFLDAQRKTMTALDRPHVLLQQGPPEVQTFLRAGHASGETLRMRASAPPAEAIALPEAGA